MKMKEEQQFHITCIVFSSNISSSSADRLFIIIKIKHFHFVKQLLKISPYIIIPLFTTGIDEMIPLPFVLVLSNE